MHMQKLKAAILIQHFTKFFKQKLSLAGNEYVLTAHTSESRIGIGKY